ncbi:amidohydrolase 2, partial [Penicillium longicatenatum]|uniref:amidohydrolase 2 n=1 Tax=Penicillium longicatenatum TaxID=1561947 RepID=UPI0025494695
DIIFEMALNRETTQKYSGSSSGWKDCFGGSSPKPSLRCTPSPSTPPEGVSDTATAIRFARETNNTIHQKYVATYPSRFGFFAYVAMHDPEDAARELERAVTQLGAKGVLINGFTNLDDRDEKLRYLDAPECEPFWAMLHRLQVPLYMHPRLPPPHQQCAGDALRIMCSGILDKYPVNIILGHCAEALPFIIHRADQRMLIGTPGSNGKHTKSLMHYFRTHFYATLAGVRRHSTLKSTIEELGEPRVMFSVDYSYESNEDAADWFDSLEINENSRAAISHQNAMRLFGLNGERNPASLGNLGHL